MRLEPPGTTGCAGQRGQDSGRAPSLLQRWPPMRWTREGNGTMKTLINVVLFVVVLVSFGFVLGCESGSPTAPSASSTTLAEAPPSFSPSTPVRTMPASFDADNLRPDDRSGFNAYDFHASYDGSRLNLVLEEDAMRRMREASKPHRNRLITVGICPVEPHHALQACGDPIWQGSMRLAGRLELAPIPLAACEGWIVVNAAELSDDKYDGWRNAPCPASDGESMTGSDGTGAEWSDPPRPRPRGLEDDDLASCMTARATQSSPRPIIRLNYRFSSTCNEAVRVLVVLAYHYRPFRPGAGRRPPGTLVETIRRDIVVPAGGEALLCDPACVFDTTGQPGGTISIITLDRQYCRLGAACEYPPIKSRV